MAIPRDSAVTFGPFRLELRTESVWRDVEEIRLRPKTFAILRYLAERPGRLVTKQELLEAVWPEVAVGDAALAVCVGEIRKVLGDDARTPRFIETVHRRGYRFIGSAPAATRSGAAPGPATTLVGRQVDLNRLQAWLERALHGERQVVFVTGEPGIGKTALVEAFLATVAGGDLWLARGQCLDHYGVGEAYLPILEAIGRLARGPEGDRVVALLGKHAPVWLTQMPAVMNAEDLAALQPRVLGATRERMLREMAEVMEALAAERPLVLLIEDLHWSDPSTLDLVASVARRREPTRLLLIGTYRPVDVIARGHPLGAVKQELALHDAGQELPLGLLGEVEVGRYLAARFGAEAGARLAPAVHKRTDGLPLFMVTVVEALVSHGVLVEAGGHWEVRGDEAAVQTAVPQSLRQMIEQQLARLEPDEQRLLEAASVPGIAFSAAALAAALEEEVETVEDRCEALARREQFIRSSGVEEWPDGTVAARYRFLHVLYQQVFYERLPVGRRARLHQRIGEREETGYRASPGERAAVLAVHFEHGRDAPRAIRYRRQAGDHALQRCAYPEAIEHLTRALDLLDRVPDADERRELELELRLTLGPALYSLRGPDAPEVEAVYLRARELAERRGDPTRLYPALWGLWYVNYGRGRYAEARDMGDQLLTLAERGSDTGRLLEAHHALWPIRSAMGTPLAALPHLERGLALYDPDLHRSQASLYGGHDAGVCARNHLALTQWLLGYADRSLAALREAESLAERLAHPMTTIITLCFAAWVHHLRGAHAAARESAERCVALANAHGAPTYRSEGSAVLACLEMLEHADGGRVSELYRTLMTVGARRTAWRTVVSFCLLAEAAGRIDDVATGLDALAAIPEQYRGAFFAPEIQRIRGELLLRRGQRDDGERCFRDAIDIARHRAERSLELRAVMSLARLLTREGQRAAARAVLGEIYAWFTEGFDTADLSAARAMLDQIS